MTAFLVMPAPSSLAILAALQPAFQSLPVSSRRASVQSQRMRPGAKRIPSRSARERMAGRLLLILAAALAVVPPAAAHWRRVSSSSAVQPVHFAPGAGLKLILIVEAALRPPG